MSKDPSRLELDIGHTEKQIADLTKKLIQLKRELGEIEVQDYLFKESGGGDVKLSTLFGDREELIIAHFMGPWCAMCSTWASSFNGIISALESRTNFVVISPDPLEEIGKHNSCCIP